MSQNTKYPVIANIFRTSALVLILLSFSCSAQKKHTVQVPSDPVPVSPQPEVAAEIQPSPETAFTDAAPVIEESVEVNTVIADVDAVPPVTEYSRITEPEFIPAAESSFDEAAASVESTEVFDSEENYQTGQNLLDSALDLIDSSQIQWEEEGPDRAIAILDEAYSFVIKVDADENPDLFQQKEDLRYMISKRILEIYASRYTATNGNHNEIPLTLNEYVEKEINRFQGPSRKSFETYYNRSGRYMPMILQALKEAGMPEELAWLPLIESGFKYDAQSKARALGLWQFIASTGQKFGLKQDTWVDERLDPEKSTAAAIAYLQELHNIFGDWTTVLAGYNCGEGRVLRTIRSQKINYLDNFWDLFQKLPYETALYVPRFLAALHILNDPAQYGFDLKPPDSPIAYDTVTIKKPVQLSKVAASLDVTENELVDLNPELRQRATPPATYVLKVPEGKADLLLAHIDTIPEWSPPIYEYHRVKKGESLSVIAQKYRTTVSRIVLVNNIQKINLIREGQRLKIPLSGTSVPSSTTVSRAELPTGGKYRVQKGDSLWLIAKKFNTDTKKIQQANNLSDTLLSVGQILVIPQ